MGTTQSKGPAWPQNWFAFPENSRPTSEEMIKQIAALSVDEFLSKTAVHKDLLDDKWPFEEYSPYCTTTVKCEPTINTMVTKCVPKKCTEAEFWRHYFCNLYLALRAQLAAQVLPQDVLMKEDDATSTAVIGLFGSQKDFLALSQAETESILRRDKEDDEKLAIGINFAKSKAVIPQEVQVEPTTVIDVQGRTADDVAQEIIRALGDAPSRGCILVMQGLSGTGKGTTVSKLQAALPKATCWSNGNVFRALTLLAVTDCEQKGIEFSSDVLTPERLAEYMQMLTFDKFNDQYDIKIEGLGMEHLVSDIVNTKLKEPRIGQNIPVVAQFTQGEVINFAAAATSKMSADGFNVLMEGRAQTLNHVRSPYRFELTLKDPTIIGMRRAAQRMVAKVAQKYKAQDPMPQLSADDIVNDLEHALAEFVAFK